MRRMLIDFAADERGAVTVDWVVLTAAVVGLGLATILVFADGTHTIADNVSATIADIEPDTGG
ncbi:hypothetical protein [Actibacterium sp. D379-3]